MEDRHFVTVASFVSEVELRVARSLLESEGIMTYVPREYLIGGGLVDPKRLPEAKALQTPESQAELARALLAAAVSELEYWEAAGGSGADEEEE